MKENEAIIITGKQAEDSVFCFLGEFGYEMISWLPYLLYLKQNLNIRLRTVSRKGSKPFYYFSDEHFEAEPSLIGDMWGDTKHYNMLSSFFPEKLLIHPGPDFINQRKIIIEGIEWTNNNIHTIINQKNYSIPDFSFINNPLPFDIKKPYVVINNKFFRQWYQKYKGPINYFKREDLEEMKDVLNSLGYSIVYNHFVEQTSYDQHFDLNDRDIFGNNSHSVNLADFYKSLDSEGRNILQLSVYNNAEFVIGPQGGNLYLPAICKKDLWILMRDGEYLDYLEFGRLYGINVNIFYEPAHILASIKYLNNREKLKNITQNAINIVHRAYTGIVEESNNKSLPLISICIFTYNRGHLIADTIKSCLEQSYDNFEIIIADDGSNDNTSEIVKSFNDTRIKYFYKEHTNAPDTRNFALKNAKGDFIIWVGSDDILDRSILEEYIITLKAFPDADILYCNLQSFDNQGNKGVFLSYQDWYQRNPDMLAFLFEGSPIPDGGTLIKKSIYDKVGNYNIEFTRAQDYEFWSRVVLAEKFNAKYVNKSLYYYRIHDGNLTGHLNNETDYSFERKILQNVIDIAGFEKLFPNFNWTIDYDYFLSLACLKTGLKFLERKGLIEGINYINRSIEIYPDIDKFKILTEIYFRLNQYESVKTILIEAYRQFPYNEWVVDRLKSIGVVPSSIPLYIPSSDLDPDDSEDFVNICIITFNRIEFTKQCIESVLKYTDFPYVITVVDNNSQDGTKDYLKTLKADGKIKNLVLLDENIGVAKASNLAWSLEPKARYYLKLDNDIVIQKPGWLSSMVKVIENIPKIGALAYNFEPKSYPYQIINDFKIRIKNPHTLGGACILIPKRTEKKLGYWCEDYGLYGEEDADYGARIHCAGLFNAYMEDEDIGIHLPAGKAGVIDLETFEAKDGIEEKEDNEYRLFKDESRRRNVIDGAFSKNYNNYFSRNKSLFVESEFLKLFNVSKYIYENKEKNKDITKDENLSLNPESTLYELESKEKAFLPIIVNIINNLKPKKIVSIGNFNFDFLEPICLAKAKLNPNLKVMAFKIEDSDIAAINEKINKIQSKYPNYISFYSNTFFEALIGIDNRSVDLILFDSIIDNQDLDFYIDSVLPKLSSSGLIILPKTNISILNDTNWKSFHKLTWEFDNIEFNIGGGFGLICPKSQNTTLKNFFSELKSKIHIYTELFRAEAFKLSSNTDLQNQKYSSDIEKFDQVLDYLEKTQIAMSRLDYSSVNQLEKEFISLFPDSTFAFLTGAIIKRQKNELNESILLIEQATHLLEIPEVIYEMKVIASSKGNTEKSREINDYIQTKYSEWNFSPSDSDYISLIFSSAIERLKNLKNNFTANETEIDVRKSQIIDESKATALRSVRIGFLSIDYHNNGCPAIRLVTPLKCLEKAGFDYHWIDIGELYDGKLEPKIENILSLDILIIQRQICALIPFNALKSLIKDKDIKIVYEIDDALTDLPFHHPHYLHFERFRPFIYEYIKNADLVTVSTEGLKKLYSSYSDKIVVLNNYFSDELITKKVTFPRYSDGPVKILFSGTITHEPDFKEIEGVLRRILNEFGAAVELLMWGGTTFSSLSQLKNVKIIDEFYNDYYKYLERLQTIEADFAVIPLNDNLFNRSKSHIKWIEYSACGIPGIYSNVGEYSISIKNEITGILVDNNYEQWYNAIRRFIEDENFREKIAKNSYETVHKDFTFEKNCHRWDKAYRSILSSNRLDRIEQEGKKDFESSIIIPVHNQLHYTKDCLEGLFKTIDLSKVEIIIINNASTDKTDEYLQSLGSKVKVIKNNENLNYSKINNQGAKIASGEYLIFLNNDTLPLPGWYDEIIKEFEEHTETGIQGVKLLYEDGTIQHAGMVFGPMPNSDDCPFHAYVQLPADFPYVNIRRQFQFVTGACLAIRSNLFNQVGGFDEGYDFGWEDTDLCMKVNQIGKQVIYNPKSVLYHFESGTKKLNEDTMNDFLLPLSSRDIKNRIRFMDKWSQMIKKDAVEFFRNDGFKFENGMLFPIDMKAAQLMREIRSKNNMTSFASSFWNFNYSEGKQILIRVTPALGDALMLTAIIHQIKNKYPYIDIFVSGVQMVEPVFQNNPDIKEFIIQDSEKEKIILSNSDRIIDYNNLIANLPEYFNGIHFMDILANIAGIKLNSKDLVYNISQDELKWAEEEINKFANGCKIIGLQLITNKDIKRSYPFGSQLLNELRKRFVNHKFILFGLHENYGDGDDILNCGLKGYSFRNQIALAYYCNSFITIDSVFFHIAHNLLRKPTLLIAGLTNPALIGNHSAGFSVVRNVSLDCLNCYWTKKCNIECMNQLAPEKIVSAFADIEKNKYIPELIKTHDVRLNWSSDYQKAIFDFFMNYSNKNRKLRLIDQDGILPDYSLDWNGVEIRYNSAKAEQLSFDFSSNGSSFIKQQTTRVAQVPKKTHKKLNIVWEGSQFVYHSLALINREHCSNLLNLDDIELTIIPYEPETYQPENNKKNTELIKHDIRFKEKVDESVSKLPYVWIRHQWPPNFEPPRGAKWIIMQPWEFSTLRKDFADLFNQADEIWTPSNYSRQSFINSGVDFNKVQVIPNGIDPEIFKPSGEKYKLNTNKKLKFLFVGGTIFRKGIDILLNAYASSFSSNDDVCLVVKDMGGDSFYKGQTAREQIEILKVKPNSPEIIYIDNSLTESEMASLYRACDIFVCPYRGEGFSLPTLEAMACGLPVIVTKGGSTDDFTDEDVAWYIPAMKRSIGNVIDGHQLTGEAFVLEPDQDSLSEIMKEIYNKPAPIKLKGIFAAQKVRKNWTWKRATLKLLSRLDVLYDLNLAKSNEKILEDEKNEIDDFLNAEYEYQSKNFNKAIELFSTIINLKQCDNFHKIHSYLRLAEIYMNKNELDVSLKYISEAELIDSDNTDVLYIKSKYLAISGRDTEALELLTELFNTWRTRKFDTSLGISLDDLLTDTADVFLSFDDAESALSLYTEALKYNTTNARACLGAGKCFLTVMAYDEAQKMLDWAKKLDPYLSEAEFLLKDILEKQTN